jgi:hypothetical protein
MKEKREGESTSICTFSQYSKYIFATPTPKGC